MKKVLTLNEKYVKLLLTNEVKGKLGQLLYTLPNYFSQLKQVNAKLLVP